MLYLKSVRPQYSNGPVDFLLRVELPQPQALPDELDDVPLEHLPELHLRPSLRVVVHEVAQPLPLLGPVVSGPEQSQHGDTPVLVGHRPPPVLADLYLGAEVAEGLTLWSVCRAVSAVLATQGEVAVLT